MSEAIAALDLASIPEHRRMAALRERILQVAAARAQRPGDRILLISLLAQNGCASLDPDALAVGSADADPAAAAPVVP